MTSGLLFFFFSFSLAFSFCKDPFHDFVTVSFSAYIGFPGAKRVYHTQHGTPVVLCFLNFCSFKRSLWDAIFFYHLFVISLEPDQRWRFLDEKMGLYADGQSDGSMADNTGQSMIPAC